MPHSLRRSPQHRYCRLTARTPGAAAKVLSLLILLATFLPALSCVAVQYPQKETYYDTVYVTENRSEVLSETYPVTRIESGQELLTPYVIWSNPTLMFKGTPFVWYYGYRLPGTQAHGEEKIRISLYKQEYYENVAVSLFDMGPRGQVLQPPAISPLDPAYTDTVQWNWFTYSGDISGGTTSGSNTSTMGRWLNSANIKFNFARFVGGQADLWMNRGRPYDIDFDTRGARDIAVLFIGPTIPQNTRFGASLLWSDRITDNVIKTVERQVPYRVEQRIQKERTVNKTVQVPFWQAPPFK
jgi:hypothetical protein